MISYNLDSVLVSQRRSSVRYQSGFQDLSKLTLFPSLIAISLSPYDQFHREGSIWHLCGGN